MTTRDEHMEFCKRRALEYVDIGELAQAVQSMGSDLAAHPQTMQATSILWIGHLEAETGDPEKVRRWIKGFK